MIEQARRWTEGLNTIEFPELNEFGSKYSEESFDEMFRLSTADMDLKYGGRSGAPKFPMPTIFEYILTYDFFKSDPQANEIMKITLDKMAYGGIYDQLGGGFARYSTDKTWTVPHFEKMLYDNGQLVSLYSHAYQKYGQKIHKRIVDETLSFIDRELSDPSGGFYSSLDADSDGEEGKFYVWELEEIDSLLGTDANIFKEHYGVSAFGNFEEKNILTLNKSIEELAKSFNTSVENINNSINLSKKKLFEARSKRIRPGLDNKVLTSWNALMITGYIDAYFAIQNKAYLDRAIKAGAFILSSQKTNSNKLWRNYKDGKSSISGFLDDYAHTILAFIKLYEATFDEKWLYEAQNLKTYVLEHFGDEKTQMFFYTSDEDDPLIARKMELTDNVIPSSNSSMAHALFLLGQYFYNESDLERAAQMLANVEEDILAQPYFYSNWARLYGLMGNRHFEVAVVGDDSEVKKMAIGSAFIPNKILLGGNDEGSLELLEGKLASGRTMIYVCENKACQLPVNDPLLALKQMGIGTVRIK